MRSFTRPKPLSDLAALLPEVTLHGEGGVRVEGIALDSRRVEAGDLFVALPGTQADGHRFAPGALEKGAVAILGEDAVKGPSGVPYLEVGDSYAAMATLASALYGDPSRAIPLVGVTGTNGKTTVTYLLEAILALGWGASPLVMGTVNYRQGAWVQDATHTTPDAIDVQALMAGRLMNGATHALLEVSSHALIQRRVDGLHFDVGIFTSFSRDHLDYHGTMEAYFEAKARLFTERLPQNGKGPKAAILCVDAPGVPALAKALRASHPDLNILTYALEPGGDLPPALWVESFSQDLSGARVTIGFSEGSFEVHSPLLGRFNLQNLLGAVGAAIALGIPREAIQAGLAAAKPVPGRLEPVKNDRGIGVFVDYAHTPEALERALFELRPLTKGRLVVLFGAGGDRDKGKRPEMGRVAAEGADLLVITTDNPRTEAPDSIIEGILSGVPDAMGQVAEAQALGREGSCWVEASRRRAILGALANLGEGDVCLIAGKGHETYQEIGHTRIPFDDRAIAREGLSAPKEALR